MALADVVHEAQEPCAKVFAKKEFTFFEKRFDHLKQQARNRLMDQGFTEDMISLEPYLHMRYDGTDCAIMVGGREIGFEGFLKSFLDGYKLEFGFVIEGRNIIVDDIRIRGEF